MVDEAEEDTIAWLATLPQHVRATYQTSDRPRPFQGPIFDRLLRGLGYPAADDLRQDVAQGFDMLGQPRGAGEIAAGEPPVRCPEGRSPSRPGAHTGATRRTRGGDPPGPGYRPLRRPRTLVDSHQCAAIGGGDGHPSPAPAGGLLRGPLLRHLPGRRAWRPVGAQRHHGGVRRAHPPCTSWGTSSTLSSGPGRKAGIPWSLATTFRTPIASGRFAIRGTAAPSCRRRRG